MPREPRQRALPALTFFDEESIAQQTDHAPKKERAAKEELS